MSVLISWARHEAANLDVPIIKVTLSSEKKSVKNTTKSTTREKTWRTAS